MSAKHNYRTYRDGEVLNIIVDCLNDNKDNHYIAEYLNEHNIKTYHGHNFTAPIISLIKKRYIKCTYSIIPKRVVITRPDTINKVLVEIGLQDINKSTITGIEIVSNNLPDDLIPETNLPDISGDDDCNLPL